MTMRNLTSNCMELLPYRLIKLKAEEEDRVFCLNPQTENQGNRQYALCG